MGVTTIHILPMLYLNNLIMVTSFMKVFHGSFTSHLHDIVLMAETVSSKKIMSAFHLVLSVQSIEKQN